ncbi:hypothetical protein AVM02_16365 [Brucella anthropi]|uniref:hypothetical protein n=1 Tax=Brucella anthropi TaxID=529 RepID=UPI003985EC15
MDYILKTIIANGGLSVQSAVSFFNIFENTLYNEDGILDLSDTPCRIGSTERAVPGAVAAFAGKNLK